MTKSGGARQDFIFRNDTSADIVVRTVSASGVARVDLYAAAPTGLTVSITAPVIAHRQPAHDRVVRTKGLARGTTRRVEPKSDGMTVSLERTVRDATGRTVHHDTWISIYRPLTGLLKVGERIRPHRRAAGWCPTSGDAYPFDLQVTTTATTREAGMSVQVALAERYPRSILCRSFRAGWQRG